MLIQFKKKESFIEFILERILTSYNKSILKKDLFHIVLSGRKTPRIIYQKMQTIPVDWSKFVFWFSDERCFPKEHPDLNSSMTKKMLLDYIPVNQNQIKIIESDLGAEIASIKYNELLKNVPDFDLVFLGIGEDGHTASLFPGKELGENSDSADAIPVFDAPKPPSERISLSLNRLKKSKEILFLAKGIEKKILLRGLKWTMICLRQEYIVKTSAIYYI